MPELVSYNGYWIRLRPGTSRELERSTQRGKAGPFTHFCRCPQDVIELIEQGDSFIAVTTDGHYEYQGSNNWHYIMGSRRLGASSTSPRRTTEDILNERFQKNREESRRIRERLEAKQREEQQRKQKEQEERERSLRKIKEEEERTRREREEDDERRRRVDEERSEHRRTRPHREVLEEAVYEREETPPPVTRHRSSTTKNNSKLGNYYAIVGDSLFERILLFPYAVYAFVHDLWCVLSTTTRIIILIAAFVGSVYLGKEAAERPPKDPEPLPELTSSEALAIITPIFICEQERCFDRVLSLFAEKYIEHENGEIKVYGRNESRFIFSVKAQCDKRYFDYIKVGIHGRMIQLSRQYCSVTYSTPTRKEYGWDLYTFYINKDGLISELVYKKGTSEKDVQFSPGFKQIPYFDSLP